VLPQPDVDALLAARHGDPFSVLGPHPESDGQTWLRALLPGAQSVEVITAAGGKPVAPLARRDAAGLFEGPIGSTRLPYRLRVLWADGNRHDYADAYAFGSQFGELDCLCC